MNRSNISISDIPVKKLKYTYGCVDSILNQTFSDFELILVDDGSPDSCPCICDEYAKKDSRIKVIHKENGGLSSARNAGLDHAAGEWISFIDSDDWIHKDYLLYLYNAAVDSNKLISVCYLNLVREYVDDIFEQYKFSIIKSADSFSYKKYSEHSASAKLFKKELWEGKKFKNGMLVEDFYTIPEIMLQTKDVAALDAKLYYYYVANSESIMNSKIKSFKFYNDHCLGYEKNIALLKKYNDKEHMVDFIKRYFNYNLWTYDDVKSTDDANFKKITKKRCYAILRKYKRYFDFKDKNFEWNLCQLSPSFRLYIRIKSIFLKSK